MLQRCDLSYCRCIAKNAYLVAGAAWQVPHPLALPQQAALC